LKLRETLNPKGRAEAMAEAISESTSNTADWIGYSPAVAREHYLRTTDEHFEQAIRPDGVTSEAAQNPTQQMHAELCNK